MPPRSRKVPGLPSKEQVIEFIQSSETPAGKREIAKAFGLKGEEKIALARGGFGGLDELDDLLLAGQAGDFQ